MYDTANDLVEIMQNPKTGKYSLWFNGKVVKIASKEQTLRAFADSKGWTVDE